MPPKKEIPITALTQTPINGELFEALVLLNKDTEDWEMGDKALLGLWMKQKADTLLEQAKAEATPLLGPGKEFRFEMADGGVKFKYNEAKSYSRVDTKAVQLMFPENGNPELYTTMSVREFLTLTVA